MNSDYPLSIRILGKRLTSYRFLIADTSLCCCLKFMPIFNQEVIEFCIKKNLSQKPPLLLLQFSNY